MFFTSDAPQAFNPISLLLAFILAAPIFANQQADSLLQCSANFFKTGNVKETEKSPSASSSNGFKFNFNTVYRSSVGGETADSGSVLIGNENAFAIKLSSQQIYSDGTNLWQYNPAQKQVLVKLIADLENNLHPTELMFRYLNTKAVSAKKELWKGATVNALTLNPDKYKEQFSAMEVWLSPRDCSPVRLHTIDNLGNDIWYSIENLTKVKTPPGDFKFKTPLGVEEIDLR